MILNLDEPGLKIDTDFEGASAGSLSLGEDRLIHIHTRADPKPKGFDGVLKGVPLQYRWLVRVESSRDVPQTRFYVHNGDGKDGRYIKFGAWVKRSDRWGPLPLERAANVDGAIDLIVTLDLAAGERVLLASMPFISPTELDSRLRDLVQTHGYIWSRRQIGTTAKGRGIWALETAPRERRVVLAATSQPAEPGAERLVEFARRLTANIARTRDLMAEYQICLAPMINPDGAAEGHSLVNGVGEAPAGGFKAALAGEPSPLETVALVKYVRLAPTNPYLEFHPHYREIHPEQPGRLGTKRGHLLNPGMADLNEEGIDPDYVERFNAGMRARLGEHNDHRLLGRWWVCTPYFSTMLVNLHPGMVCYTIQAWNLDTEATTSCAEALLFATVESMKEAVAAS